jgi:hypothetical protein
VGLPWLRNGNIVLHANVAILPLEVPAKFIAFPNEKYNCHQEEKNLDGKD